MDRFRKISLHSRLWIAVLAAAAVSIGTWSTAPTPANAASVIGAGIPGLYAQYPYYPYPPGYYPYYPPPAPTYSPVPSYPPQPSFTPQAGRSGGNIARQLSEERNASSASSATPSTGTSRSIIVSRLVNQGRSCHGIGDRRRRSRGSGFLRGQLPMPRRS